MSIEFRNNAEKTLYNATFNFCLQNGYSQEQAEQEANTKIEKVRKLSKHLRKSGVRH